jgi:hypothetical protein
MSRRSGVIAERWRKRWPTAAIIRRAGWFVLVTALIPLIASACGTSAAHRTSASGLPARVDRPIPGAPATPRWLRVRIWRFAAGLGDARPTRIVVKLGVRQNGRLVDRVWMRGTFVCTTCSRPYGAKAPRGHLAGFTVLDSTRRELSFSLRRG